ncbi:MAG: hypothetical protein HFG57_10380 [Lachnospiraceae bacterium]|nr:hypothetical protein [Lachnospiraceae bacterium]
MKKKSSRMGKRKSDLTEERIKTTLKFSMILFEVMFFIIVFWYLCFNIPFLRQSPLMRSLGIFTGVVYLFLCPIAPFCGIICGGLGYMRLKKLTKEQEKDSESKRWRRIALIEVLLGVVMVLPCMILFLGACSGQI